MENIKKLLGKRIRELRIKKGLKQSELAEVISIEPRSISRIEAGFHFPKDEHLIKFANALEVSIDALFTFSQIKTSKELQEEIIAMINNADKKELQEIYRILLAILK